MAARRNGVEYLRHSEKGVYILVPLNMSSPGNRLLNYTIYFGTGRVMGVYWQYRNNERWFLNIRETPHKFPIVSPYEFTYAVVPISQRYNNELHLYSST